MNEEIALKEYIQNGNKSLSPVTNEEKEGFIAGYRAAAHQLNDTQGNLNDAIDLLSECRLQLEYLSNKFGKIGTTENILARLTTFIKS